MTWQSAPMRLHPNRPEPATVLWFDTFESPVGALTLAADDFALRHIEFARNRHPVARIGWQRAASTQPILRRAGAQLLEYFAGSRREFDLPLQPHGTAFQREVWLTLAKIPFGKTWSYRDLAREIGKPAAVRAVGAANGRNPLPIVLPCHRVIGADGDLTGFGGGLDIKAALLQLEGALPTTTADFFD